MADIDRALRDGLAGWDRDDLHRLTSQAEFESNVLWYEPGVWDRQASSAIQHALRLCYLEGSAGPYLSR
jgi:hypothetical protein